MDGHMKNLLAPLALALMLSACASAPSGSKIASNTLSGDQAHPDVTINWVRTELYFGVALISEAGASDKDVAATERHWREFLDREVTPRFPDGLSVYDVYGQWRTQGYADIERLHSKEVMLLYPDTPAHRADVEAIRAAWKKSSGDLSVLRVTQPADVSF
jgi:Protein of unknown function (DUF3574)